jgi:hypothetical protein
MPNDPREIYCIYTDKSIRAADANSEHVIPLALGGADYFQIRVCREFNARVGSQLDGAMANDFLVAMARTEYDARGHSGRKPTAHVKNARFGPDERPAQAHFSVTERLRIWDALERRELTSVETAGKTISCTMNIDLDLRLRFVAKVALGAGYFVYRDLFREQVRHDELRGVMNLQKGEDLSKYRDFSILSDDPLLTPEPNPDDQLAIVRTACQVVKGSVVMLIPSPTSVMIAVGVLGKYIGMLNVAANTANFPNSGHFAWGHVVALRQGAVKRCSFRGFLHKLAELAPTNEEPHGSAS